MIFAGGKALAGMLMPASIAALRFVAALSLMPETGWCQRLH
jgi:hypothetical protein